MADLKKWSSNDLIRQLLNLHEIIYIFDHAEKADRIFYRVIVSELHRRGINTLGVELPPIS